MFTTNCSCYGHSIVLINTLVQSIVIILGGLHRKYDLNPITLIGCYYILCTNLYFYQNDTATIIQDISYLLVVKVFAFNTNLIQSELFGIIISVKKKQNKYKLSLFFSETIHFIFIKYRHYFPNDRLMITQALLYLCYWLGG